MTSLLQLPLDAILTCIECGEPFLFSGKDQEYFLTKDYASPTRCKPCRIVHRQKLDEAQKLEEANKSLKTAEAKSPVDIVVTTEPTTQKRWEIICSKCGEPDTIPFMPQPGRPVHCRKCYVRKT
jgi:CxxC-x17-CxxC domain-containing protein